jgi:hypothetical protein
MNFSLSLIISKASLAGLAIFSNWVGDSFKNLNISPNFSCSARAFLDFLDLSQAFSDLVH